MLPLAMSAYAALLLLIGFGGGAFLVVLAVSVIVVVTFGLAFIFGRGFVSLTIEQQLYSNKARYRLVERQRDAALDVLAQLDAAEKAETSPLIAAVADHARRVLDGGDYLGRLRAAQEALEEAVSGDVDAHAADVFDIVSREHS